MEELTEKIENIIETLQDGIEESDWSMVTQSIEMLDELYSRIDRVVSDIY